MKEQQTQKAILDYLRLTGWHAWKNHSVGIKKPNGSFIPSPNVGSPDILAIKQGRFIGIEVKSKYGKLSDRQKEWQATFAKHQIPYVLAFSVDDVIKSLTANLSDKPAL